MSRRRSGPPAARTALFILVSILVLAAYAVYGVNIVGWRDSPDFGWRTMYDSGPNVVADVMKLGGEAGLRAGDRIVAVNGREYSTFDELYFEVRRLEPGALNVYTVERNGERLEIAITSGRLGTAAVLSQSAVMYAIGFAVFAIGLLVFLMKPGAGESLMFFLMTALLGMEISFAAPSDLIRPMAFFKLRLFNDVFMPAPLLHLTLWFPRRREFLRKTPWAGALPYLVSFVLFGLYLASGKPYWDTPPALDQANNAYLLLSIIVFLLSTVWNLFGPASVVVRLQSQVIFIGIFLGLFVPMADMILRSFTGKYLFPDPTTGYAFFLTAFPLSIGYTIVKHDLFAIDTIVRRTYGYILSTGAVVLVYAAVVSALNATFHTAEVSRSPYFSLVFALAVVFTFRPLHGRIQALVDRVFYRRHYDYRKTIRTVSEAMTGLLDRAQIERMLIGSVVEEMFLENGLLLLPDPSAGVYRAHALPEQGAAGTRPRELAFEDPLARHLRAGSGPVIRQELELNPRYEGDRDALGASFDALGSEIVIPLAHKEQIQGVVSLGRKKSGRMFTAEDVDLLNTMANQSAIALENTRLMEENVEKGRMEEELKIAHDLQMSMLPAAPPEVEGVQIAARSLPAREVGGDFFDFIEMGGRGTTAAWASWWPTCRARRCRGPSSWRPRGASSGSWRPTSTRFGR